MERNVLVYQIKLMELVDFLGTFNNPSQRRLVVHFNCLSSSEWLHAQEKLCKEAYKFLHMSNII